MKTDIEKVAYENLYSLFLHYSSLIFRGRVSIITICILLWAYVIGVEKEINDRTINIWWPVVTIKMLVSFFATYLLPIFAAIENAYYSRLLDIVECGRKFEGNPKASYFNTYRVIKTHPFFFFYFLNALAFTCTFLCILWSYNSLLVGLVLSAVAGIPYIFLALIYYGFRRRARDINKSMIELA